MIRQKQNQKTSLFGKTFMLVTGIFFVAMIVFVTIQSVATTAEMAKIQKDEDNLTQQNSLLSEELVRLSSLNGVSSKAQELGFVKPEKVVYINKEVGVAAKLP